MLGEGYLETWEAQSVTLDEEGVSEAYFPLWGVADADDYLRGSNKLRQEAAEAEATAAAAAAGAERRLEESCAQEAVAAVSGEVPSAGVRVAWGAWFWVKRVVIIATVCVVGSLLVTMAMNPSMTFFDAANLLMERIMGLIGRNNG